MIWAAPTIMREQFRMTNSLQDRKETYTHNVQKKFIGHPSQKEKYKYTIQELLIGLPPHLLMLRFSSWIPYIQERLASI